MQRAEYPVTHVELFDMAQLHPTGPILDLEPRVQPTWHTVLERDVDRVRWCPAVARDHGPAEATEESTVLPRQHAVWRVAEFRHPHHLRVSFRVLRGVKDEVEHVLRRHTSHKRVPLTLDHALERSNAGSDGRLRRTALARPP